MSLKDVLKEVFAEEYNEDQVRYLLDGDDSGVPLTLEQWEIEYNLSKIAYEWEIPEVDGYGNPREPYETFEDFKDCLHKVEGE